MRDTISNINAMKVGLEILLLVFRTSRILIETGLRLNLFLNLRNTLYAAWIAQFGLTIQACILYIYIYIYIYIYAPVGEASILICCHVKHDFDILVSG